MKRQQTLDDSEPVIESLKKEKLPTTKEIKPRSRTALQVYDELQAARLEEDDPLF